MSDEIEAAGADQASDAEKKPYTGRPRGRPKGSTAKRRRYKRTAADARRAGVGSTEASAPRAEAVRTEAEGEPEITRRSLEERRVSIFDIPEHRKKPGRSYQFHVVSVLGERVGRHMDRDAKEAGWRPERAADWPELADGLKPDDPIEIGGQMLMGRPMHLSMEADRETYAIAKQQEMEKMRSAAEGHLAGGQEGLANIRGVRVAQSQVDMQLAYGNGPISRVTGRP